MFQPAQSVEIFFKVGTPREWYICMLFIKLLERRKIFGDYIHGFFAKHSCESGISYFTGLAKTQLQKI